MTQFMNSYVLYTYEMNFACIECTNSYPQFDVKFEKDGGN